MNILLTGGAGYIGSHTAIELLDQNHDVIVVDNFSNSSAESVRRVEQITGKTIKLYEADVCDEAALTAIFNEQKIDAVIHFAGLKSVGESVSQPLNYYQNNLLSTIVLVRVMQKTDVRTLVFSSSATVYGSPDTLPLTESSRVGVGITNPYGHTKFMNEQILRDVWQAQPDWSISLLRYFNPVGAHESGLIGEDPKDTPNNLMPYITQVAVGRLKRLQVFGDDYDTADGTCIRDYIHVVDLARGHVAALEHSKPAVSIYNLGTGHGTSVLELVEAFQSASHQAIPYDVVERRFGDVVSCYADCSKAERELNWHAEKSIQDACRDSWKWQSQNPKGYSA